ATTFAADAKNHVAALLIPQLTKVLQSDYVDAQTYIQMSSDRRAGLPLGFTPQVYDSEVLKPLRKAQTHLENVLAARPDFLFAWRLHGTVCESLQNRAEAYRSYTQFLDGFDKLQFEPGDYQEVRKRRMYCEDDYRAAVYKTLFEKASIA